MKSPVVLIVFRRPELTKRVLQSLMQYEPTKLYVIADGPRSGSEADKVLIQQTRDLFNHLSWDCEVIRDFSDTNLGLRERVLSGLDFVFSREESAIILEDDCVPSAPFFRFAEELLQKYSGHQDIALVSANNFGFFQRPSSSYFFSSHAHIWGWATWKRTWVEFRSNSRERFVAETNFQEILDLIPTRGKRKAMEKMLRTEKTLDSWAINFSIFCYQNQKLAAVPKVNLALNIGFGANSTHTKFESYADEIKAGDLRFPLRHPDRLEANLCEMRKESFGKRLRWFIYPLVHPFDFVGRVARYFKILKSS